MSNQEIKTFFDLYMRNDEADEKIQRLQDKVEKLKNELKEKKKKIDSLEKRYKKEITKLEKRYNIEIDDLEKRYKKELDKLNAKLEGKTIYKILDAGKIQALSKAGWSTNKIAEEMGLTASLVSKYVCWTKEGAITYD